MPMLAHNRDSWNAGYDWSQSGEDGSETRGSSEPNWWVSLPPRIRRFVSCARISESERTDV